MSEPELLSRQRQVLRAFHELESEPARRQQECRKLTREAREACQAEAEKGTRWAQAGLQEANDALGTAKKVLKNVGLEQKLGRIRLPPPPKAKGDPAVELRRSGKVAKRAAADIERAVAALQQRRAIARETAPKPRPPQVTRRQVATTPPPVRVPSSAYPRRYATITPQRSFPRIWGLVILIICVLIMMCMASNRLRELLREQKSKSASLRSASVSTVVSGGAEVETMSSTDGPHSSMPGTDPWASPDQAQSHNVTPDLEFQHYWETSTLGYPRTNASIVWVSGQSFERGYMLWRSDTERICVFFEDGAWQEFADDWHSGVEICTRGDPPAGLYSPVMRLGYLWGKNDDVCCGLGWAVSPEKGFCAKVQDFEKGFMLCSQVVEECLPGMYNMARGPDFTPLLIIALDSGKWQRYPTD